MPAPVWTLREQTGGVRCQGVHGVQSQPCGIGVEPLEPGGGTIDSPNLPLIPHPFRAVGGLAAGGGAGIEDLFAWLGIEQQHDALGLPVLHAPVALGIARQGAQIARTIKQGESFRQVEQRGGSQAGLRQLGDQRGLVGAQGIEAQIEGRRSVAGESEGFRFAGRAPEEQLLGQPKGEGVAQGQGGCGVSRQAQPLPGRSLNRQGLPQAQHVAQKAVHHGCQPLQAAIPGQLHRGAHGRRRRHPLQKQELVKAHMQQPAELGRLPIGRHSPLGGDPGIEQGPLADGAVGQICRQGAIPGRQGGALQGPVEGSIRVGASGNSLQHGPDQTTRRQPRGLWGGRTPQGHRLKQTSVIAPRAMKHKKTRSKRVIKEMSLGVDHPMEKNFLGKRLTITFPAHGSPSDPHSAAQPSGDQPAAAAPGDPQECPRCAEALLASNHCLPGPGSG